ncbi:MAG: cupin domain-containing protein [Clostridia bacterium]|nr:cupin domain-containing protein [Clostridia bacterium]
MQDVQKLIERFELEPHVEGGAFRELYHASGTAANRLASGVIYYALGPGEQSDFHVLDSDEYWFYHAGTTLELWSVQEDGSMKVERLGIEEGAQPCVLMRKNVIFGARHAVNDEHARILVSCVTVPEFTYETYRILPKEEMLTKYPASAAFFRA